MLSLVIFAKLFSRYVAQTNRHSQTLVKTLPSPRMQMAWAVASETYIFGVLVSLDGVWVTLTV